MTHATISSIRSTGHTSKHHEHYNTLRDKMPEWLLKAPPPLLARMREHLQNPPQWYERASSDLPDVAQALKASHHRQRRHEQALREVTTPIPSPEAFAEPLLTQALKTRFGLDINVRTSYLFHASRAQVDNSFSGASRDPMVEQQKALKRATQPLLTAALQNFKAAEALPGGMDDGQIKARIFNAYPILGPSMSGTTVAITAQQFATVCRELDLGGKYQALINAALHPSSQPADAADATAVNVSEIFKRNEQSAFELHVHMAHLQQHISKAMYSTLLGLALNTPTLPGARSMKYSFLQLWEVELNGIVVISPDRDSANQVTPIVVYIPDDPVCALKEYESTLAFTHALRDRMLKPGYLEFFQRFVPARQVNGLFSRLQDCLQPLVWIKEMGWHDRRPDANAQLHLRERSFSGELVSMLIDQKISVLKDDALYHAVPTAAQDLKTLAERVQYFEDKFLQALNVAAFFVPVLGEIMLAVTALQLSYEVYEGIESWTRGEKQQAWAYLMDVAENLALMAALAAAGASAGGAPAIEKIPVETPSFIEELKPVILPDGQTRLWKPDLAPFAHDIVLPAGLEPDEFGLYHYQGKTWLALQDKVYSLKKPAGSGQYRLEHPGKALSYEPPLRHNGAGAWQHELDQPLEWQGPTLLRRLLPTTAQLSDTSVQRILQVSDCHEAVLRRTLSENLRAPALLEDTAHRFELDHALALEFPNSSAPARARAFATSYSAQAIASLPGTQQIAQHYPKLPALIVDELAQHASPGELAQLINGKVPMRLAQEARSYQQQVRLARAYEGLYLDSVHNPDTDALILHTLQTLPGWSRQVRLEVRRATFSGALVDSIGADNAAIRKVLTQHPDGYQAYDSAGHQLHGRDNLYASVLHALPDEQRLALGFPGTWDGLKLKQAVQQTAPLPRSLLRRALAMQPPKPGRKSPMRLADGRAGYALSGRGTLSGFVARETLLDMIRWLNLPREAQSADTVLSALESTGLDRQQIHSRLTELLAERDALQMHLSRWNQASSTLPNMDRRLTSRNTIHDALWQHWYDSHLPELGRDSATLRLQGILLIDFPEQLPAFLLQRVRQLQLIEVELSGLPDTLAQQVIDTRALERFYQQFAQITSLEISRPAASAHLDSWSRHAHYRIASSFPELRELRLLNQNLWLTPSAISALRQLNRLELLDLSGNQVSNSADSTLFQGMSLRFLGLDRVGLQAWPAWLDSRIAGAFEHISLRENQIWSVPEPMLNDTSGAERHTLISLQGNALPMEALMTMVLDKNLPGRRFSFELDVPPAVQARLDAFTRNQAELREAVDSWAETSSSQAPLSDETQRARRLIGDTLIAHTRNNHLGRSYTPLRLEGIALADFPPQLPLFAYTQVRNLQLVRVSHSPAQLDEFLRQFQQVSELELQGHVQPMQALPSVLQSLPRLGSLTLQDQGLLIDQQAIEFFAGMPRLAALTLDGNRLGIISDVSRLSLRSLSLANVGLQTWPEWLDELLPLDMLDLDNNQITELPAHILYNPRNDDGHTEISLLGNPLSFDTMYRAHTSENGRRSYSFNMNLPEEILRERRPERHESDTSSTASSDGNEHSHSPAPSSEADAPDIEDWLLGSVDENEAHRTVWQQLEQADDAQQLLDLVGRLTQTAPYRAASSRADFVGRVWRVLEIAQSSVEERQLFNGMAQEALVQEDTGDQTCHDGAWLVFNQIEIRVFTEQALREVPSDSRGQALFQLTQRLYRLQELDDIAREQASGRDEAEVRLAYRLRWAQALDLPLPPSGMLYQSFANLRSGELDEALARVQQGERGEAFMRYAGQRDFWVEYLKEAYAERFTELEQGYQARVLEVPDQHPSQSIEELGPIYQHLEEQHKQQVAHLIRELTLAASHQYA